MNFSFDWNQKYKSTYLDGVDVDYKYISFNCQNLLDKKYD